jgi:ComF family protein
MQSLLRLAFPPQCLSCTEPVSTEFGLCGSCWKDMPFITGLVCDTCGVPLLGEPDDTAVRCDDCMSIARPWSQGRSAVKYAGTARKLILGLKHGDRLDLVHPFAQWLAGLAQPMLPEDTVIVPVPLHALRLVKRRFNQSALLANALGKAVMRPVIPDLLIRQRHTKPQDGMTQAERFVNQSGAIRPARHGALKLAGRPVLLVDDVMTSGATMAAAADACHAIGARRVDVLALARVTKEA